MHGQYLQPGHEVVSIANPGEVQAIGLVSQADAQWIIDHPESEVDLQIWGRYESAFLPGRLSNINPRARDDLPHEAFAATAGGVLAVVPRSQVESTQDDSQPEMMLTAPRVKLEIEILAEKKGELLSGQTGIFMIRNRNENMGKYLLSGFKRFINENNFRTHGL